MSEEKIYVDTLVTEDMSKDELYDYAKYLEYRKEELLNINHSLQQKVEQLENMRKEAIEYVYKHIQEYDVDGTFTNLDEFDFIASPQTLLNILNKGSENDVKKNNTHSN